MGSKHDDQDSREHPQGVPSPGNEESPDTEKGPAWVNHDPFLNRRSGSSEPTARPSRPTTRPRKPTTQPRKPTTRATDASEGSDAAPASASSAKAPPHEQRDAKEAAPKKTRERDEAALPKVSVDPSLIAPTPPPATAPKTRNASAPKTRNATAPKTQNATAPKTQNASAPKTRNASAADTAHQDPDRSSSQADVDTSPPRRPPRGDPAAPRRGDGRRPRRRFLLPLWIWILIVILGLTSLLLAIDLRNTKRFRLLCKNKHLSVGQARRFPWPFGFETLGGSLRPVAVFDENACATQYVETQKEAEEAFLIFVLRQVRGALTNPSLAKLSKLQAELEQCEHLTAQEAHEGHAKELRFLLADIAYRSGRAGLARIEMTLREALAMFQKARRLGADRYGDLDEWIAYLDRLVRQVAPSPRPGIPSSLIAPDPTMRPRPVGKAPSPAKRPERSGSTGSTGSTSPPPLGPGQAPSPGDAGSPPPDAGASGGSGILL